MGFGLGFEKREREVGGAAIPRGEVGMRAPPPSQLNLPPPIEPAERDMGRRERLGLSQTGGEDVPLESPSRGIHVNPNYLRAAAEMRQREHLQDRGGREWETAGALPGRGMVSSSSSLTTAAAAAARDSVVGRDMAAGTSASAAKVALEWGVPVASSAAQAKIVANGVIRSRLAALTSESPVTAAARKFAASQPLDEMGASPRGRGRGGRQGRGGVAAGRGRGRGRGSPEQLDGGRGRGVGSENGKTGERGMSVLMSKGAGRDSAMEAERGMGERGLDERGVAERGGARPLGRGQGMEGRGTGGDREAMKGRAGSGLVGRVQEKGSIAPGRGGEGRGAGRGVGGRGVVQPVRSDYRTSDYRRSDNTRSDREERSTAVSEALKLYETIKASKESRIVRGGAREGRQDYDTNDMDADPAWQDQDNDDNDDVDRVQHKRSQKQGVRQSGQKGGRKVEEAGEGAEEEGFSVWSRQSVAVDDEEEAVGPYGGVGAIEEDEEEEQEQLLRCPVEVSDDETEEVEDDKNGRAREMQRGKQDDAALGSGHQPRGSAEGLDGTKGMQNGRGVHRPAPSQLLAGQKRGHGSLDRGDPGNMRVWEEEGEEGRHAVKRGREGPWGPERRGRGPAAAAAPAAAGAGAGGDAVNRGQRLVPPLPDFDPDDLPDVEVADLLAPPMPARAEDRGGRRPVVTEWGVVVAGGEPPRLLKGAGGSLRSEAQPQGPLPPPQAHRAPRAAPALPPGPDRPAQDRPAPFPLHPPPAPGSLHAPPPFLPMDLPGGPPLPSVHPRPPSLLPAQAPPPVLRWKVSTVTTVVPPVSDGGMGGAAFSGVDGVTGAMPGAGRLTPPLPHFPPGPPPPPPHHHTGQGMGAPEVGLPAAAGLPVAGLPGMGDSGGISSLLSNLLSQGVISMPEKGSTPGLLGGLPEASIPLPLRLLDDDVTRAVGRDVRAEALKERREGAIDGLYTAFKRQCATCGRRFTDTEEYSQHLDMHYRKNQRAKTQKVQSRMWYVSLDDWIAGTAGISALAPPIPAPVLPQGDEQLVPSNESRIVTVRGLGVASLGTVGASVLSRPLSMRDGERIGVGIDEGDDTCALCGEKFEVFFSDAEDDWVYCGAVLTEEENGAKSTVHVTCKRDE